MASRALLHRRTRVERSGHERRAGWRGGGGDMRRIDGDRVAAWAGMEHRGGKARGRRKCRGKRGARARREIASRSRSAKMPSGGDGMPNQIEKRGRSRACWIAFFLVFFHFYLFEWI
ncbi:hypothetical protein GQ55_5G334800 [Panicum hallii var. hallii]|uniref:Uncharacterized protein n=1 Tax=Panicum hallii var. hallii TaxID=1504633 RepID=A0A2T7DLX3_9POAL|nr:hypothetical protein GQ55_5G334800 [Panicum hallii var. hallii]